MNNETQKRTAVFMLSDNKGHPYTTFYQENGKGALNYNVNCNVNSAMLSNGAKIREEALDTKLTIFQKEILTDIYPEQGENMYLNQEVVILTSQLDTDVKFAYKMSRTAQNQGFMNTVAKQTGLLGPNVEISIPFVLEECLPHSRAAICIMNESQLIEVDDYLDLGLGLLNKGEAMAVEFEENWANCMINRDSKPKVVKHYKLGA